MLPCTHATRNANTVVRVKSWFLAGGRKVLVVLLVVLVRTSRNPSIENMMVLKERTGEIVFKNI